MMNYKQAEQFLFSLSNLPRQKENADRRRTLMRMRRFLALLGNPEKKIPHVIHITGTSGKGSVAMFLSSMLAAAGFQTCLMLSPHGTRLTERWQINGVPMDEKTFIRIIRTLKPALNAYAAEHPEDPLSFFELVTAIGFLYFAKQHADWAVIEVGMGGQCDATNVIPKKDIAVITNIGRDHLDAIGPTLANVAREKAGIMTQGCTVFTGETRPRLQSIIRKEAKKNHARLKIVASNMRDHMNSNKALASTVARFIGIDTQAILRGLRQAKQPLRYEIISRNPTIILDGAHNADKMKTTIHATCELRKMRTYENLHLVIGFSNDKNVKTMVRQLSELSPASVACTRNTVNPFRKVADPAMIARLFQSHCPSAAIRIFLDPRDAYTWVRERTKKNDILLVTGSIFLSGEIRGMLTFLLPG